MGRGREVARSIWESATPASSDVPAESRRSLGEGCTPLQPAACDSRILLKRDDLNPTGSHKDRAAAFQVARAASRGDRAVTISSSGNAAIATSRYAQLHGLPAVIYVHPETDPAKLASIDGATTILVVTERAINGAKLLARELGIPNLRPSVSEDALVGFTSLGEELAAELPADVVAVVMFATSGASALAVARSLARLRPTVALHVVQGEGSSALVDPDSSVTEASAHGAAAGRLGVRRSRRGRQLREAVAATGGAGHVVGAAQIAQSRDVLAADGIDVSDESAANLSVALQLVASVEGRVCCVMSGAPPGSSGHDPRRIDAADEHVALEAVRGALT